MSNKKKQKITGKDYYALLCNCGFDNFKTALICGVYATKQEALDANKGDLEQCLAKHKVTKCNITIEI